MFQIYIMNMQNQQPVTYVYANTPSGTSVRPDFATQTAKVLGIMQIIFGILLITLHVGCIIEFTTMMVVGHGIWTGIIVSYLSP